MLRKGCFQIVVAATAVFVVLALLLIWLDLTTVHSGSARTAAESSVTGLPDEAVDIHWYLPHAFEPNTIYDFSISQDGFEKWVKSRTFDGLEGPILGPTSIATYDPRTGESDQREFEHAILYSWRNEDAGVHMLYDPVGQRAYYFRHTR